MAMLNNQRVIIVVLSYIFLLRSPMNPPFFINNTHMSIIPFISAIVLHDLHGEPDRSLGLRQARGQGRWRSIKDLPVGHLAGENAVT